ncbi:allophanate hydrolase [Marinobacter fuscus]|uniref:Allophanate hydrolase n=1 Tax=Marinobacter fuscus TaxID=2109942 RepID=A0A2T1K495_9GAMM|nr:allophanate hydrolase subunit 1 [Marinobacter fuscus]PSF04890.1 allophanate hydrolase [Marinobacter fuscus]
MSRIPRIENAGVGAWLVRLFERIDEGNLPWILALTESCEQAFGDTLVDLVPSYTTLLVQYDPSRLHPQQAWRELQVLLANLEPANPESGGQLRELPVWYHASVGPDLERLSREKSMDVDQLIALHTGREYRVYALGFAPGFAFMGSVDPRLESPRLSTPRQRVYPGSVALAGRQTSAYPAPSPGGWNLLGRTPLTLFERNREPMSFLQIGDRVQLVPVSKDEFIRLGGDVTPQEER